MCKLYANWKLKYTNVFTVSIDPHYICRDEFSTPKMFVEKIRDRELVEYSLYLDFQIDETTCNITRKRTVFSIILKFTNAYYCYCIYTYYIYIYYVYIPKLKWKWTTRFVVVGYDALKKSSGNDSGRNCIYPVGQATNMSSLNCCYRPYNNTWTAYSCCIFSLGKNRTEFLFYQVKVKVLNAYSNSSSANFLFVQHIQHLQNPQRKIEEHSREQLFRDK